MLLGVLLAVLMDGCGERSHQGDGTSAADPLVVTEGSGAGHPAGAAAVPAARTDHATTAHAAPADATLADAPAPRAAPLRMGIDPHAAQVDVIPAEESPADAEGRVQRQRLVRGEGKYPLIRIEETVVRRADGEHLISRREMVGDHLMISAAPGKTAEDVAAMAGRLGMTVRRRLGGSQNYLLAFTADSHAALPTARQRLAAEATVRVAEPDWLVHADGTPNDPLFSQLWGMNNTGQTGGVPDADIDAPEAWDLGTGSRAIRVGVIDTGIDYTHPDLVANIWNNPGETGLDAQGHDKRTNGIDDDHNGYVDDWRGWDFLNEDNDPFDDNAHGTHCSGTIGGSGNDGTGIAGVCWRVSLIGLKFLSSDGTGAVSDAVEAQLYANQMHFDLTSNSWSGGGYSQALKDAIDAAGAQGALYIAAAGNNAEDNDVALNYPSSYTSPNIIAVAATDHADAMASFSNYGLTTVDLGAPGVNVVSSVAGGGYASYNGTSMATPHVAGACALLKSLNPSLTGLALKQALLNSVDVIPALQGRTVTGGRLNIGRAALNYSGTALQPASIAISDGPDADTVIEPGEEVTVSVVVASTGTQAAINVTGALVSNDPAISVTQGVVSYGTINAGAQASPNQLLRVQIPPSLVTPHPVTLTLRLSGSEPDGHPRTWNMPVTFMVFTLAPISGVVRHATGGAPIAGAVVSYQGPTSGSVIAGAQGDFVFSATDGVYVLGAAASGFNASPSVSVQIPPGDTHVELLLGRPDIAVTPAGLVQTISAGGSLTRSLSIANTGSEPLVWQVASSADYTVSTSDQPGGPAFAWNDIAASGTPFTGLGDDNLVGPFPLGFSFPWYGGTVNQFRLASNGYLSFSSTMVTYAPAPLPSSTLPGDLVAFFLRDWDFATGGSAHYKLLNADTLVIQYTDVPAYGNTANRITCQVVLKSNGSVTMYYQAIGDASLGVVGIQDGMAARGAQVAYNQTLVHAGLAVRILPALHHITLVPSAGTVPPGAALPVAVTIDARTLPLGVTSDLLVIQSNDPDEATVEVPITTTVSGNHAPVATAASLATWMDQRVDLALGGSDADGDALTCEVVSGPSHGALTGSAPNLVYEPFAAVTGADAVVFQVRDATCRSAPATVALTVNAFTMQVNFQPAGVPIPAGYVADTGETFAARNGFQYGWSQSNTANTRDRDSALSPDQRYDTLTHLQKDGNANAVWEAAVPNGSYEITAVCGDAGNIDSVYRLQIEGVLAVSGTPTAATHWFGSAPGLRVRVGDGRLTVGNGVGAINNKLCFLTLHQVPSALFAAKINFQPAGVSVPSGWVADTGAVYGPRNGLAYGWTSDNSANVRARNSPASPSFQFDTFNHMQKPDNPDAVWEIAVPNGNYELVITCGDPSNIDSVYRLQVEGFPVVSGTPTAANHWISSNPGFRVNVSDGRLTVRGFAGAINNKINLIEIMQVPQGGG